MRIARFASACIRQALNVWCSGKRCFYGSNVADGEYDDAEDDYDDDDGGGHGDDDDGRVL